MCVIADAMVILTILQRVLLDSYGSGVYNVREERVDRLDHFKVLENLVSLGHGILGE